MAIQERASGIIAWTQSQIDRLVSPSTRKQYYDNTAAFAKDQPFLFTFLLLQLALCTTPLFLFLTFFLGVLAFSFITATLFSLFWLGVALLVLIPTLFITVSLALIMWIWAVSSFLVARWVYGFVPVSVKGDAEVALPNWKRVVVEKTGEGYGDVKADVKDDARDGY